MDDGNPTDVNAAASSPAERRYELSDVPAITPRQLLVWGLLIEGGSLLLAVGLALLSGQHFWRGIEFTPVDFAIGCAAALPMLLVLLIAGDLRELVRGLLGPALANSSLPRLALVALLAGVCEEALFRGVLEPWWSGGHRAVGFVTANLLFGLLHAVTWSYFLLATAFGAYLSLLTWAIGEPNLLRAIVCHALYDFLAFLWIARLHRRHIRERALLP